MRTVLLEPPAEIESWLQRRRELGQDRFDEIWDGEYHVAPAPHLRHGDLDAQVGSLLYPLARAADLWPSGPLNLGEPLNYRIPDLAYRRERTMGAFADSAAIVVEIVSPGDQTWAKFDFFVQHGVEEIVVVDPNLRQVARFVRGDAVFDESSRSELLGISAEQLAAQLDWPPGE